MKGNKIKIGNEWKQINYKLNPEDYLDENSKKIIRQIKVDLQPVQAEGGTAGEYDCFALFEGKVGSGKSNAANLFCMAVDETYSPDRTIYRDWHYWRIKRTLTKNLNRDMDACRGKAINIDELRRILHSKDSMSQDAKAIEKDLGDIRALGLFIAACIDDVKSIMRYVRETRIDLWFYCRKRGEIWVYKLYTTGRDRIASEKRINFTKKMLLQGIHPHTPYKLHIKPIPKNSNFWIRFKNRELKYKGASAEAKENIKMVQLDERVEKIMNDTVPITKAAKILKVSNVTVWKWAKKKKLHPIHTYKGDRYSLKELNRLIISK